MDSLFFDGETGTDFASAEVLSKLQFVDLVFVLGFGFERSNGSGDAQQSVSLSA
jgi:hypothetical protein